MSGEKSFANYLISKNYSYYCYMNKGLGLDDAVFFNYLIEKIKIASDEIIPIAASIPLHILHVVVGLWTRSKLLK